MSQPDETIDLSLPARFATTQWSLVMQAQHRSSPEGQVAFATLCQRYWYPLYAFVRSAGNDVHQAQDLTQGFFQRVMEKNYIGDADPARGKFRTFLLTSFTNYLANEYDKRTALKRGGDCVHFSLEFEDAERRYSIEPVDGATPESRFEQQWARSLLDRVIKDLRREFVMEGNEQMFDELKQFLATERPEPAAEIGKRLKMKESAVRVAVHRLRIRYRRMLREEIAATIGSEKDVDDEIANLMNTFTRLKINS